MGGGWADHPNAEIPHLHPDLRQSQLEALLSGDSEERLTELPVHDIPDGSELTDPFDKDSDMF